MGARHWTAEEDAVLRSFWHAGGTIMSHIHKIPGRSAEGAKTRAAVLELGARHRPSVPWSPEEDAILRGIWATNGSLKSHLHRLPGRTWRGALVRANTIGLKARNAKQRADCYSWVEEEIDRVLADGVARTVKDIAAETVASDVRINQVLRARHGAKYRIAAWVRTRPNGSWWPKWLIGTAADTAKPSAKNPNATARAWRARKRIREGRINPFAILTGGAPVVQTVKGRVIKHLHDDIEEQAA